jgi:threonine dehydrogenase-like Zn-dependent dehydrogenase
VAYSGICGSELGGYLGHNALRKPPLVMGHEFSGEIVALGEQAVEHNPDLAVGQHVVVNPLWYCNRCRYCLSGRHNLCRQRQLLGAHQPGSYAELVKAHARMVQPLPGSLDLAHAALAEPLACALRVAELAACTPLDTVLITGLGPIGLLTLQALRAFGVAAIMATDTDPARRAMGLHFGVRVFDPLAGDVVAWVRAETGGADVAIDAVGAAATRQQCLAAVAAGGKVVFIGLHEEESSLPVNLMIRQEITGQGAFGYTPHNFNTAVAWLAAGRIKLDRWLVTAPLAEGPDWFERLLSGPGPVAKVLLYPADANKEGQP